MLGSQSRKKESRMAVAKRQRRERPAKIDQRMVRGPEWGPRVKRTALWLAQFTQGRLRRRRKKHIDREAKIELSLSSLRIFCVGLPSSLEDVFSFACQIKLSCSTGPPIASNFCCSKTEPRKLQTSLTYMVLFLGC